jgi:hypothetical protein
MESLRSRMKTLVISYAKFPEDLPLRNTDLTALRRFVHNNKKNKTYIALKSIHKSEKIYRIDIR